MYGTLGAGMFSMFAFFFGLGTVLGTALLAVEGNYIAAVVVFVLCAPATYVCIRVELTHPIYKKQ